MNNYWLLWTYGGNYSSKPISVTAESPQAAANRIYSLFSDDFLKNGTVYVFDTPPVLVIRGDK